MSSGQADAAFRTERYVSLCQRYGEEPERDWKGIKCYGKHSDMMEAINNEFFHTHKTGNSKAVKLFKKEYLKKQRGRRRNERERNINFDEIWN